MPSDPQLLAFHPLADLFPLIEGAEFDELVADIRAHGVREPIWIYQGKILDGRNRYRAAQVAGVECPWRTYDGDDPIGFVISLNLKRRHLSESQRAMVAAKLATFRLGDNQHSEGLPIGRGSELLNVGERSVARAREVQEHGAPELIRAVESGAVSVSAAADIATQPLDEQREIVAHGEREILRKAQEIRARKTEQRRAERDARLIEISKGNADLPRDRRYPIILADPAWQFSISANDPRIRAPEHHYQTMSLADICDMRIGEKIATPDAVLFLWVPAALLFVHGASVLDAWGFEYRTNITWVKDHDLSETARRFGLGFYCRTQHEHLLIATRGERLHPSPSNLSSSVIYAPRREHSRKPDEAYALIERMYPELPKIELFARSRRPGWSVWGNQAPPPEVSDDEPNTPPPAVASDDPLDDIPSFLLRGAP
jgi:N6-adenosine-specific RNA methylase IME4/ParB-like chromosome segregation protein Spo0J